MKRQLERLKGKRLVTGDTNLMTKNEICINTTSDGGVEVKEIGVDGKIKDLASGGSKEYDDLNTYLYYDDRIIEDGGVGGLREPLCGFIASILMYLRSNYPNIHAIVKVNNTKDIFGIDFGNYLPLEVFLGGSGSEQLLYSIKGISIPKYVFSEYLETENEELLKVDKMHIFDLVNLLYNDYVGDFLKTKPTITREEFFDLLK